MVNRKYSFLQSWSPQNGFLTFLIDVQSEVNSFKKFYSAIF